MTKKRERKFLFRGEEIIGIERIKERIESETNYPIPLNYYYIREVVDCYKKKKELGYINSVLYYNYLKDLKYYNKETKKYESFLKHDLEYYIDQGEKNYAFQKIKAMRLKGRKEVYLGYQALRDNLNEEFKKEVSFPCFRNIMQFKQMNIRIKSKFIIDVFNSIEYFDILERRWKLYFIPELIEREAKKRSSYKVPARKRMSTRFDSFYYTQGIFNVDKINLDYIEGLINSALNNGDVDTFLTLIHDSLIRGLDSTVRRRYIPEYEDEPEDLAQYYTEYYYNQVIVLGKRFKYPWRHVLDDVLILDDIELFRNRYYYQDPHEEVYLGACSLYDSDLDLAIKRMSGTGTYTYKLRDELKETGIEEAIEYLVKYSCIPGLTESGKICSELKKYIFNELKGETINEINYSNILKYLINIFKLLFKVFEGKLYINLDKLKERPTLTDEINELFKGYEC